MSALFGRFAGRGQAGAGERLAPLALMILLAFILWPPAKSEAKLDPYYVLRGQEVSRFQPRIIFVLDTSGSMNEKVTDSSENCRWEECEKADHDGESRISAARRAIHSVVQQSEDSANFALMAFGHAQPPEQNSEVPTHCQTWEQGGFWNWEPVGQWVWEWGWGWVEHHYLGWSWWGWGLGWHWEWQEVWDWVWHDEWHLSDGRRFQWVDEYQHWALSWDWWLGWYWDTSWRTIENDMGGEGYWMLCGDNRPFPYLRHDQLGVFTLPDDQSGPLPDGPLYSHYSSGLGFEDGVNAERPVQFMSRYLGPRFNLDCSDSNQLALVNHSLGDFGSDDATRESNLCGRDFYYWPYVDGFPGYTGHESWSPLSSIFTECDSEGDCTEYDSQSLVAGVIRRDTTVGATLFSPFYSEAALNSMSIPAEERGPLTRQDSMETIEGLTDTMHRGGLDATGGTPWASAVGNVDEYINAATGPLIPKPQLLQSNAAFSHENVASYLSFILTVGEDDLCVPTSVVLITDGKPTPTSEGGGALHARLSKFRKRLGVKTYVVGFGQDFGDADAWNSLQNMACSAAGSKNAGIPCSGPNDFAWDTCADPEDPSDGCAYFAENPEALALTLVDIVSSSLSTNVPSGLGSSVNEFWREEDSSDAIAAQTFISAYTEMPAGKGHVKREPCDRRDDEGNLEEACQNVLDEMLLTAEEEDFAGGDSSCALGRVWDAGSCLQERDWKTRKLYTHGDDNAVIRIADAEGKATAEFRALLMAKLDPPLTPGSEVEEADAIAAFLLGRDFSGGWKLPGLARSSPSVIRRIPRPNAGFAPSVGISDPHCAGRKRRDGEDVPTSLFNFATQAWNLKSGGGYDAHYDYAEAVVVGDDFGVLHAFHFDSGNEIFGFIPNTMLGHLRTLSANGPSNFGQSGELDEHAYGLASPVNQAVVYDEVEEKWRHLAVFGFGPGGKELVALDLSHMGRLQEDDPLEVLWTSESVGDSASSYFDSVLGETWSRPAVSYAVPSDDLAKEPKAYLIFGSGYGEGGAQGRTVVMVDAITGETVRKSARLPDPQPGTSYDRDEDYAIVTDLAVGSHCLSRYWAEVQETYIADPAGRLFRWDLGAKASDVTAFDHKADSGTSWSDNGGVAVPVATFAACRGKNEFKCSVGSVGNGKPGDVFTFGPAVVSSDRIDDGNEIGQDIGLDRQDRFLIALNSGSFEDRAIDGGDSENDFHSSLYIMVDDHRAVEDRNGGFDIPGSGGLKAPGKHERYMRQALSQIERTRYVEYPDGTSENETRYFSKRARPLSSPRIVVSGYVDGDSGEVMEGVEVYYIDFSIHEPGIQSCDDRWHDAESGSWTFDQGANYQLRYRLIASDGAGLDLKSNGSLPTDPGDGFGSDWKLQGPTVTQLLDGDCMDGNCSPEIGTAANKPCDPNQEAGSIGSPRAVVLGWQEITGFSGSVVELP